MSTAGDSETSSRGATLTGMAASTPAIAALVRAGVEHRVHAYEHDPAVESFGEEAVEAMGVDAGRVFKTLIVSTGDARGRGRAGAGDARPEGAGGRRRREAADMADPAAAERSTGYLVGAISPIGQKRRLDTVVDESALAWDTVFCSAGRRGLEVELAPLALLGSLVGGRPRSLDVRG